MLEMIAGQIRDMSEVSLPSMTRVIVGDGCLAPVSTKWRKAAQESYPRLQDYDPKFDEHDPRQGCLAQFDEQTRHITERALVVDARQDLAAKLDEDWARARQLNIANGEQVQEVFNETREVVLSEEPRALGTCGLLATIKIVTQVVQVDSRMAIVKRSGALEHTEWTPQGPEKETRESAIQRGKKAPQLLGGLLKLSPNSVRAFVTLGNLAYQQRKCAVQEGHFLWWDPVTTSNAWQEVSGCISFVHNLAVCEEDDSDPSAFVIRPAKPGGWEVPETFGGGAQRAFKFKVQKDAHTRRQWVSAVRKNIQWASLVR